MKRKFDAKDPMVVKLDSPIRVRMTQVSIEGLICQIVAYDSATKELLVRPVE